MKKFVKSAKKNKNTSRSIVYMNIKNFYSEEDILRKITIVNVNYS